jgi:hypothetical protein
LGDLLVLVHRRVHGRQMLCPAARAESGGDASWWEIVTAGIRFCPRLAVCSLTLRFADFGRCHPCFEDYD